MSRRYLVAALIVWAGLLISQSSVRAQQPVFLSAIEDLPVMPGLVEKTDSALSFETASGRIVEIAVSGPVTATAVADYYRRTLPQLGWTLLSASASAFAREQEVLVIDIFEADPAVGIVEVHFRLSPKAGK
ncbi:MAG: hypothetical protein HQ483_19345 [Rhodospirillales bacterium]|nr:hypothetical protein [Rhodospirillales bacterium]